MATFTDVLTAQLRRDPGRPLITFYDQETGERVELSVTTYANWVAKAASLLAEEGDVERGQRLRIDLPTHWLGPVFLGAAWTLGLVVTDAEVVDGIDAVVCGPDTVEQWSAHADRLPVFACSLLPLGVRFTEPLPAGVHDVGLEIWSQPDAFSAWDPPTGDDPATVHADRLQSDQAQLMEAAAAGSSLADGGRLLTATNPASPPGVVAFTEPLARGGSLVLVRHLDPARVAAIAAAEQVTHRL